MNGASAGEPKLAVDWPRCRAHGVCAAVLPELVWIDQWGYPVVDGDSVPTELFDHARRAVRSCPELALHLVGTAAARDDAALRTARRPGRS